MRSFWQNAYLVIKKVKSKILSISPCMHVYVFEEACSQALFFHILFDVRKKNSRGQRKDKFFELLDEKLSEYRTSLRIKFSLVYIAYIGQNP